MAFLIRPARSGDAARVAEIYRPFAEETQISFEEIAPSAEEMAQRMANPLYPWLVLEDGSRVVGYVSTSPLRGRAAYCWSVETGLYLDSSVQGRGLGRRLLTAHLDLLEGQGFVTAIAGISLPNAVSVALHEKLGFTLTGIERGVGFKLGKWVDVGRWQKDLAPRAAQPVRPRPLQHQM